MEKFCKEMIIIMNLECNLYKANEGQRLLHWASIAHNFMKSNNFTSVSIFRVSQIKVVVYLVK